MRAKKSQSLVSTDGAFRLMTQAMMGAALGLTFGLAMVLSNPAVAVLLNHSGGSTALIFVVTLVTTFAVGATLTGIVFIIDEDKET